MKKIPNTIKYFIYARKSSESEDRQMASINDQLNELQKIAKERAITIVEVFSESKSAKDPGERVVFTQMLQRIRNGEANGILCWKLNRLTRNTVDSGMLQYLLQKETIKSIITKERDYFPEDNALIMGVEMSMANQFIRDLSTDTKRGLRNRAERGLPSGVAPIGYLNDMSKERGSRDWLKDPDRYHLVEKLLRMMLTGKYSVAELHTYAKDTLKLTTKERKREGGKPISLSYMYTLLKDPIHAGFFYQKSSGEEIRYKFKAFKPMLSEEEYWRIQSLLGKKGVPRVTKRKAVYNYFSKCGNCDGQLSTDFKFQVICSACKNKFSHLNRAKCSCGLAIEKMKKPTFLTYTFYYCINNKKKRTSCPKNGIEEKSLEEQLLSELTKNLLISKELSAWCISNIGKIKDEVLEDEINKEGALEKQRVALEENLRRLLRLRVSSDHSAEKIKELDALEKELRQELATFQVSDVKENTNWLEEAKRDFDLMSDLALIIKDGTVEEKKELFAAFGTNLEIMDKKVAIRNKKSVEEFQKYLNLARAENESFEPAFYGLDKAKSTLSGALSSSLLRR